MSFLWFHRETYNTYIPPSLHKAAIYIYRSNLTTLCLSGTLSGVDFMDVICSRNGSYTNINDLHILWSSVIVISSKATIMLRQFIKYTTERNPFIYHTCSFTSTWMNPGKQYDINRAMENDHTHEFSGATVGIQL